MAAPKMIERRMVFGTRENVKDGLHYLDENNIVWVAGKSLVVLDTQLGTQELIPCSPSCESVTAMALSFNRRILAVAESGKSAAIVIYLFDPSVTPKLKRRKVLQLPDLGSCEYVSLSFSRDGRQLAALGGHPEWKLLYWNVEKMKIIASSLVIDSPIDSKDSRFLNQCSVSPKSSNLLCVSGQRIVKFFEIIEGHMFPAPGGLFDEQVNYLAHTWIQSDENHMIVSTGNGDLLLLENKKFLYPLPLSPSDGLSINSLISYTKGFVCGGDMGLITIFERTDNKEMYRKVRTFRFSSDPESEKAEAITQMVSEIPTILSFSLTPAPAEEYLAFLTSTKQIYCLNLPNADFTKAEDMVFQPVGQPFHSGAITSVDTCSQRPLIVTAGRDRCIFLWNSITNSVEMRKKFRSEILSVAIHPSGLHLLVGFADGLKLMNICDKELREYKAIGIRSCCTCCFSNGGQFFAAMHSTTIHVYYTYTCELLGHLRGHIGKVRSIQFVPPSDTRLVSVGTDGAVCEFNLCDFHKVADNIIKSITYNCAVSDTQTVWAAGNDRKLRQLERARMIPQAEYDLSTASILSLSISQKMKLLFGGCEDGTIRVFNSYLGERLGDKAPTSSAQRNITIETHSTHAGSVTRVTLTYDEGMLVSVGEDGLVVFWDVVAPHRGARKEMEYSNELLMDRKELESVSKLVVTLGTQVSDLRQRMIQQQRKREQLHEEQMAKLEREFGDEIAKQKAQIDALEAEKNEQAIRFTELMAELEKKGQNVIEQTNEDYTSKIESLRERADQLRRLTEDRRSQFNKQANEVRLLADKEKEAEKERQRAILHEMDDVHRTLLESKEQNDLKTAQMAKLIEEDNDVEIIKQRETFEKHRREQEEELAALQATNNAMLSKENLNKADLEAKMADVTEKLRQQQALESHIEAARRDIDALANELKERGETISEKDRRIADLKKKNQELEKFKFVLEYKIKELKAQIDPRDEEIRLAKEKLTNMEAEGEKYQHSNENLVLQIRSLQQKRSGQQKELDGLIAQMKEAEEFQARLWTELSDVYNKIDNPRKLKEISKALFDKYASAKPPRISPLALSTKTATDEVREYNRERDYLERNLAGLKHKVTKDAENSRSDRSRIISEHIILVKEVNELRKEARVLATRANVIRPTDPQGVSPYTEEYAREVEIQLSEILRLRSMTARLEAQIKKKGLKLPTASKGQYSTPLGA